MKKNKFLAVILAMAVAVGAAGVEALGHDKQVDGRGHQRRAQNAAQQPKAFFVEQPIVNGQVVLPPLIGTTGIICMYACKVKSYF